MAKPRGSKWGQGDHKWYWPTRRLRWGVHHGCLRFMAVCDFLIQLLAWHRPSTYSAPSWVRGQNTDTDGTLRSAAGGLLPYNRDSCGILSKRTHISIPLSTTFSKRSFSGHFLVIFFILTSYSLKEDGWLLWYGELHNAWWWHRALRCRPSHCISTFLEMVIRDRIANERRRADMGWINWATLVDILKLITSQQVLVAFVASTWLTFFFVVLEYVFITNSISNNQMNNLDRHFTKWTKQLT